METWAAWAEQANEALAEAGSELRIDHRSYAEQGIERLPGLHLGPTVREMEARGIETERGAEVRRRERVNEQLRELTTPKEELAYERTANAELERGDCLLQEAVAGLPRATAAHVSQALSEGLKPVAELKPILAALARGNQALASQLETVSPEMHTLVWHLTKPRLPTFLGWDREEWTWLGAVWLLGAAMAVVGVNLLIGWLT